MGVGVRVQENNSDAVVSLRRQDHRENPRPQVRQVARDQRPRGVGKRHDRLGERRHDGRERFTEHSVRAVHDLNPLALQRHKCRQGAEYPQPLVRADRQVKPRRIGAIHDIEIVVAGQDEHAIGKTRMAGDGVKKFRPLGGASGVGHVAGDQNCVEWLIGVERIEFPQDGLKTRIAARTGPAALDPETIALADEVNIREVGDAPNAVTRNGGIECRKIARLPQRRVGGCPHQGGYCHIGADDDDAICERHAGKTPG